MIPAGQSATNRGDVDGGTRVLIVDDHVMLRESMRVALELAGNDVVGEAGDGNEALRLVEELRPSIVLMDVSLPCPDGIEVTRRLCARDPELRVVMVTMHSNPALVARAVRAGAPGRGPWRTAGRTSHRRARRTARTRARRRRSPSPRPRAAGRRRGRPPRRARGSTRRPAPRDCGGDWSR